MIIYLIWPKWPYWTVSSSIEKSATRFELLTGKSCFEWLTPNEWNKNKSQQLGLRHQWRHKNSLTFFLIKHQFSLFWNFKKVLNFKMIRFWIFISVSCEISFISRANEQSEKQSHGFRCTGVGPCKTGKIFVNFYLND